MALDGGGGQLLVAFYGRWCRMYGWWGGSLVDLFTALFDYCTGLGACAVVMFCNCEQAVR